MRVIKQEDEVVVLYVTEELMEILEKTSGTPDVWKDIISGIAPCKKLYFYSLDRF
jgi:hypothetical protein